MMIGIGIPSSHNSIAGIAASLVLMVNRFPTWESGAVPQAGRSITD
jgi:hypothetical protein